MMVDITNWADTRRYPVSGYTPVPTLERIWGVLRQYNVQPLDSYLGMDITDIRDMHEPLMEGCSWSFRTDKIEKINVAYMVFMKRMAGTFFMIFPEDGYDFPVFASELVENPSNVHILLDLHPLQDLTLFTEYRRKYFDDLNDIWRGYLDLNNDFDRQIWYRSQLGPCSLQGKHKLEVDRSLASRCLDVVEKYLAYYMGTVVARAEPVTDPWLKDFASRKKRRMKELYISGDPGTGPVTKAVGKERAHKIMSCLF